MDKIKGLIKEGFDVARRVYTSADKALLLPASIIILALSIFIGNDNGKYQAVGNEDNFTIIDTSTGKLFRHCVYYNSHDSDASNIENSLFRQRLKLPDLGYKAPSNSPSRYYSIWTYKESDLDYNNFRCYYFEIK